MTGDDGIEDKGKSRFTAQTTSSDATHPPGCADCEPTLKYTSSGSKESPTEPKGTALTVTEKPPGYVHGPDCSHAKKNGFIERIGEELKTTHGKVIAFGVIAAVAVGAYVLMNQPEQSASRA